MRLVSWDSEALRNPATAYAQTLPASHPSAMDKTVKSINSSKKGLS
jgi:hypothetical protein